jgi:hypothetical protein
MSLLVGLGGTMMRNYAVRCGFRSLIICMYVLSKSFIISRVQGRKGLVLSD